MRTAFFRDSRASTPSSSDSAHFKGCGKRLVNGSCSWEACATRRFLIHALSLLIAVGTVSTAPSLRGDEPVLNSIIALENDVVRIGIDRHTGKLLELTDRVSNLNRVGDSKTIDGLWTLTLIVDDRDIPVNPAQAKSFHARRTDDGQSLQLAWDGFEGVDLAELRVQATVRLDTTAPVARWQIAISKPEQTGLRQVAFPRAFGLARQTDEHLAVPLWMGHQLSNPRSLLCPPGGRPQHWSWEYPGRLSAQCIAFWGGKGHGFTQHVMTRPSFERPSPSKEQTMEP